MGQQYVAMEQHVNYHVIVRPLLYDDNYHELFEYYYMMIIAINY